MISISEEDTILLRSLVSVDTSEIESAFETNIRNKAIGLERLTDYQVFLSDKLLTASEKYSSNIKKLIELLTKEIEHLLSSDPIIEQLCMELDNLSEKKGRIQAKIDDKKNRLKKFLPQGNTKRGCFSILYRPGTPYLGVVSGSLLPSEFLTPQPDRKKLLRWFKSSGEAVPGTEIRIRKDTVIVKKI
ncbi:hypothetical protein KAH81_05555 [bacterium]|nr:hypothetical protein [bacterium]